MPLVWSARAERRTASASSLLGESVPETNSKVVVVGSSRVVVVVRIYAVKKVRGKERSWRQERGFNLDSWSELYGVGPVLGLCVLREIRIQEKLERRVLANPERAARPMLRIEEPVFVESVDVDRVSRRFVEETRNIAAQKTPEAFREIDPTPIIRNGDADVMPER